ncbi:hypothetical protein D3C85_1289910 [compost metagenome]
MPEGPGRTQIADDQLLVVIRVGRLQEGGYGQRLDGVAVGTGFGSDLDFHLVSF